MSLIYISGPFTAETAEAMEANIKAACDLGRRVRELGFSPLVPHIAVLQPEGESGEVWRTAMRDCLAMLRGCQAIVMTPNWSTSRGARMERWVAERRLQIPVLHDVDRLLEVVPLKLAQK